jgi:DNA helicase-2/ATP-dependent DNA helicase PcrA
MESMAPPSGEIAARLLAGCDPQQREAITTTERPLCVLAAAGSGKTRVLTRRIAWRVNEGTAGAAYVLALTFTRKAASELRARLAGLGLTEPATAGTFHAIALSELRRLAAERGRQAPVVVSSKARLLAAAGGDEVGRDRAVLSELASEIEWAQAQCLTARDYAGAVRASGRTSQCDPATVSEVWKRYEREKQRRGVLDFDDLLLRCASELQSDPDFAASARWRLRHIFVDEYQDVNPAQERLLAAWLGDNDDLCVVGDPDQAIYAWNGSNPRALLDFPLRHPGAHVIHLAANYRSTEVVLAVASSVLMSQAVSDGAAPGRSRPSGDAVTARALVSACPRPSVRAQPVIAYDNDADEARGVVMSLRRARGPGSSWSSISVLARTNAQLTLFERELEAADVPFRSGGGRAFLARPSVRRALDSLTGPSTASGFAAWLEDLAESGTGPRSSVADEALECFDDEAVGAYAAELVAGKDEDLAELSNLALEYLRSDSRPSADGFVSWLEASLRSDPPRQAGDAVDVMTFHRAKGLEWRVVFVTGLEDGLVPIAHARSPEAVAEERRLLYVACTRAMDDLRCSWARERSFGGRRSARKPSPYLAAIESIHRDFAQLTSGTPESSRVSQLAVQALLAGRERSRREP